MAIIYKYGKRCYTAGEMKGVVQIDTTGFHGIISANNLTPRNGEQVTLTAEMEEGYTLKCFVVDDENIMGSSFKAHLGTNYVKGLETIKATQEVLQKPILSLKEVLSLSSDNTKLYKPILNVDSVISNYYDKAPNAILKPAGLVVSEVTSSHYDELKQLEITGIEGKWTNAGSNALYQMTIWADKNSMDSDLYVNGVQYSLYMGNWTSVGNSCFYLGYFGQATENKTYSFVLKKKGYKDSKVVTHTVPSKESTGEKDIKVSIWSKDYDTDSYPSIVSNGTTVKGTESDTYKTIFAKTGLGTPAYLDSAKCSYSYENGTCSIYGFDNYAVVTPTLTRPTISESSAEYWLTSTNEGSLMTSAKIANPNSTAVTAHITISYKASSSSSGSMNTYTVSKSISKNSYTYINPTLDVSKPSVGDTIKLSVYLTASGYEDSAMTTQDITLTLREGSTLPTLTAPTITEVSNDNFSITVRYTNPSSNPYAHLSVDDVDFWLSSGGYKDITYRWGSLTTMTKICYVGGLDTYLANNASKTFTRPELTTPTAPTLSINNNSYDYVQFNVYNPNSVALDVYDTGGNMLISQLAAKSTDSLEYSYSGNTYSLVCYFMGDSRYYSDSARSSISASRPLNATLSATATADKGSDVQVNVDIGANYEGTWSLKIYSQNSYVDTTKTGSGTGTGFVYACSGTAVIGDTVDLTLTYTYNGQSVQVKKSITITERT